MRCATFISSLPSFMTIGIWQKPQSLLFVLGKGLKPLFQKKHLEVSSQELLGKRLTKLETISFEVQAEEASESQLEELLRTPTK